MENCKGCGNEFDGKRGALSRYGHGDICPDCGTREALEGNFIPKKLDALKGLIGYMQDEDFLDNFKGGKLVKFLSEKFEVTYKK